LKEGRGIGVRIGGQGGGWGDKECRVHFGLSFSFRKKLRVQDKSLLSEPKFETEVRKGRAEKKEYLGRSKRK